MYFNGLQALPLRVTRHLKIHPLMTPVCMVLSAPHTSSGYETYARCTIYYKAKAIKDLGFHGQSYPLFVGEPKPLSFELILEKRLLFEEILNDRLLMTVKPAGRGDYQQMEKRYAVCQCTNRLSVISPDSNIIRFVRIFAPYGVQTFAGPGHLLEFGRLSNYLVLFQLTIATRITFRHAQVSAPPSAAGSR